jgi:hypothetical protein
LVIGEVAGDAPLNKLIDLVRAENFAVALGLDERKEIHAATVAKRRGKAIENTKPEIRKSKEIRMAND